MTYNFRLRDRQVTRCTQQARVNAGWNYCNETQKSVWLGREWLNGCELRKLARGASKEFDLDTHTIEQVWQTLAPVTPSHPPRAKLAKSMLDAGWSDLKHTSTSKSMSYGGGRQAIAERLSSESRSGCGPAWRNGSAGRCNRVWRCNGRKAVRGGEVDAAGNVRAMGLDRGGSHV
jgi:hypothetical protein